MTVPSSDGRIPVIIFKRVVFPAPFSPTRAHFSLSSIWNEHSRKTDTSENDFDTFEKGNISKHICKEGISIFYPFKNIAEYIYLKFPNIKYEEKTEYSIFHVNEMLSAFVSSVNLNEWVRNGVSILYKKHYLSNIVFYKLQLCDILFSKRIFTQPTYSLFPFLLLIL